MIFPDPQTLADLEKSGQLTEVLTIFGDIIGAAVTTGALNGDLVNVCRGYLGEAADPTSPIVRDGAEDLRKAVFAAIFQMRALVNSSVETLWNIIKVYGPLNGTATSEYLESLPRGVPQRFTRLFSSRTIDGNEMPLGALVAAVMAPRFAAELSSLEILKSLRRLRKPSVAAAIRIIEMYAPKGPMESLRAIMPQLSIQQATDILHRTSTVEEAIQTVLDAPDSHEFRQKKQEITKERGHFRELTPKAHREPRRPTNTHMEKTLSLSLATEEEEDPDDELDVPFEVLSTADKKLWRQEAVLFQAWKMNPEIFNRDKRRSASRKSLRNQIGWTDEQIEGWARNFSVDKKREQALEWRYTSGSNGRLTDSELDTIITPEPIPEPSVTALDSVAHPEAPNDSKRNHHKDRRNQIKRDKQRSKKRDQKQNRLES